MTFLVAEAKFTSVVLSWNPPQEPNGAIIAYEVSYRSDNPDNITRNTTSVNTTIFTTPPLLPKANISFSVRAYTHVGPGPSTMQSYNMVIPPEPVPRE